MKPVIAVCGVLAVLMVNGVRAAEPAAEAKPAPPEKTAAEAPAMATEPVIPKRELVFDVSEEEHSVKLFAADPRLLEQRYVALFRIHMPRPPQGYLHRPLCEAYELLFEGPLSRCFEQLITTTPEERLPPKDVVSALVTETSRVVRRDGKIVDREQRTPTRELTVEFTLFAPTADRARELAEGLLALCDYGLSYPTQQGIIRLRKDAEKQLAEHQAELQKAERELARQGEQLQQLEQFDDITKEALDGLTTQRRLISVDLAGVRARLEACEKILAGRDKLSPSRVEQVETIKIAAEIELVGLMARQAYIDHIVEMGRQRMKVLQTLAALNLQVQKHKSGVRSGLEEVQTFESQRERYVPLEVEDGKIMIRRIKWEPPENEERS